MSRRRRIPQQPENQDENVSNLNSEQQQAYYQKLIKQQQKKTSTNSNFISLIKGKTHQNDEIRKNTYTKIQNNIIQDYMKKVENQTSAQRLLIQRQDLLEELHEINIHLNQMLNKITSNLALIHTVDLIKSQKDLITSQKVDSRINYLESLQIQQHRNQKLIQSLSQQLNDYTFMLTGEYWTQLQTQLRKQQFNKKNLIQQINSLNKNINKSSNLDSGTNANKQEKKIYQMDLQLKVQQKKQQNRTKKLKEINSEIEQKKIKIQDENFKIVDLGKLVELYEDEQLDEGKGTVMKKNYDKLKSKKEVLQKVINSYNNNHLKIYNKKLALFRQLDEKIQQMSIKINEQNLKVTQIMNERKKFTQRNEVNLSNQMKSSQLINNLSSSLKFQENLNNQPLYIQNRQNNRDHKIIAKKNGGLSRLKQKKLSDISDLMLPKFNKGYTSTTYNEGKETYHNLSSKNQFMSNHHLNQLKPYRRRIQTQQISKFSHKQQNSSLKKYVHKQIKLYQKKINAKINMLKQQKLCKSSRNQQTHKYLQYDSQNSELLQSEKVQTQVQKEDRIIYIQNSMNQKLRQNQKYQKGKSDKRKCLQTSQEEIISRKISLIQKKISTKMNPKQNLKQLKNKQYYQQLCQKLGREKLLIEQEEDIGQLLYNGLN